MRIVSAELAAQEGVDRLRILKLNQDGSILYGNTILYGNGLPIDGDPPSPSNYVKYLPATLRSDTFIGQFLLAFEKILTGDESTLEHCPGIISSDTDNPPGLEEVIQWIFTYFHPTRAPEDFLPWLASWVALSLWTEWSDRQKRNFLSQVVPLYRLRGTKAGLQALLKIYLDNPKEEVTIYERPEYPPYYFQVELTLATQNLQEYRRKQKIATAIIEQEKPAHTFYALQIKMPTMRIVSAELAEQEKIDRLRILKLDQDGTILYGNTILGTNKGPSQ